MAVKSWNELTPNVQAATGMTQASWDAMQANKAATTVPGQVTVTTDAQGNYSNHPYSQAQLQSYLDQGYTQDPDRTGILLPPQQPPPKLPQLPQMQQSQFNPQQKYDSPAAFQGLFEQAIAMQAPALEAQTKDLLNRLAQRGEQTGTWHSGMQAGLAQQGAQGLQTHYAQNALQQALQMGSMDLHEQNQLYNQFATDRNFGLQQFQAYAPYNYLTEYQRQNLPLQWTQTMGQVPGGTAAGNVAPVQATTTVRNGATVWIVNGR